ncbi:hypothetical protein EX30DRAFT_121470 [Ascodesmis nigricans]|uniref:Uncharacterized protein n=1 Tax=Ascodesmis nigricans TaxID=341454 RepID=A0A4S2MPH6_9PEZI|nr:hypothetical protein EX30DRAFT_121470 [Ascodesmis nigricans]
MAHSSYLIFQRWRRDNHYHRWLLSETDKTRASTLQYIRQLASRRQYKICGIFILIHVQFGFRHRLLSTDFSERFGVGTILISVFE